MKTWGIVVWRKKSRGAKNKYTHTVLWPKVSLVAHKENCKEKGKSANKEALVSFSILSPFFAK